MASYFIASDSIASYFIASDFIVSYFIASYFIASYSIASDFIASDIIPWPRGLVRFMSCKKRPELKYSLSGGVLLRHCSVEFMKHVLPKFWRPHTPRAG